jgi:nitrite reductase/ring-hydroxylating ferredoxin subunit
MATVTPSRTTPTDDAATIGSVAALRADGSVVGKVGTIPVVAFWDGERAWAVEDRCPHMGFPLHRGTVQDGMLTCHWHHARFDLASGCTFDLWADDAVAFDVELDGDDVLVRARPREDGVAHLERRLVEGLEEGLTLVVAKAVLGLLARGVDPSRLVEIGLRFAAANRSEGWGPGMTVAQCALNLRPHLDDEQLGRALTQALAFLGRDTAGQRPHFPVTPLTSGSRGGADADAEAADATQTEQLARWYRRFVENRSTRAAERVAVTASGLDPEATTAFMFAACTDHVFLDEGHVVDYLNKAREAVAAIGGDSAEVLLPTVVRPTARATRHEEVSEWREPVDLLPVMDRASAALADLVGAGSVGLDDHDLGQVGWALLDEDPVAVADQLVDAARRGATAEQLARAVALAAALRIVRFHTQNDISDWESVHHTFTTANAVHQAIAHHPTPELLRGVVHGAMRVHLDRFLNVPAARLPSGRPRLLDELEACWSSLGAVDEAGEIVAGHLAAGGRADEVVAELCRSVFREDAGFHWYQSVDAAAAQVQAWPEGSDEAALVLVGAARWLAAHTPTVRRTDQVVAISRRLLRGEAVHEADDGDEPG